MSTNQTMRPGDSFVFPNEVQLFLKFSPIDYQVVRDILEKMEIYYAVSGYDYQRKQVSRLQKIFNENVPGRDNFGYVQPFSPIFLKVRVQDTTDLSEILRDYALRHGYNQNVQSFSGDGIWAMAKHLWSIREQFHNVWY